MKLNNEKEWQFGTEDKSEEVAIWTYLDGGYCWNYTELKVCNDFETFVEDENSQRIFCFFVISQGYWKNLVAVNVFVLSYTIIYFENLPPSSTQVFDKSSV